MSGLDFIQMLWVEDRENNPSGGKRVTRLELFGNGHLSYERGAASRVQDAFWTKQEEADWQDRTTDYVMLSKEDAQNCFQRLVDAEFFGKAGDEGDVDSGSRELLIYSRIGKRTGATATRDESLLRLYRDMLKHFE